MKRVASRLGAAAVVVAALLGAGVVGSDRAGATHSRRDAPPRALRWLALGDSYSSGEGLDHNDSTVNPTWNGKKRDCERATGSSTVGTGSKAYSVVARQDLGSSWVSSFELLACTGAITNQWHDEWNEAGLSSTTRDVDLVTLSMGGNNIGFSQVLEDCIGLNIEEAINDIVGADGDIPEALLRFAFVPSTGCHTSETELRKRVDMLVGHDPTSPHTAFGGTQTLPDMYREIAKGVAPGGHVVVLGYPNIFEEPSEWTFQLSLGRCQRVRADDARMFRSVLGYLNQQTALAVQAADGTNGVHFDFVDISKIYENDVTGHHGLCTGSPWLNGITVGVRGPDVGKVPIRPFRSFHPTQLGHTATGDELAGTIKALDWSDLAPIEQSSAGDVGPGAVALPADAWSTFGGASAAPVDADGAFTVSYAGTFWGGATASLPPSVGCDYRLQGMAQLVSGDGYGFTVRAAVDPGGGVHGQGVQYDPGVHGYRDTLYPDHSENGAILPAPIDSDWHAVSIAVTGTSYESRIDGKVVFSGSTPAGCGELLLRLWRTSVRFKDLTVEPYVIAGASPSPTAPRIDAVTAVQASGKQQLTITGSGFGTAPGIDGVLPCIALTDVTAGWVAGHVDVAGQGAASLGACDAPRSGVADLVTLQIASWTDTSIVITGLGGGYGDVGQGWVLTVGDKVRLDVANAQTGAGPVGVDATVVAASG